MIHARRQSRRRPGFTLVELMISIALVVVLILGVNQVFLYTSQAIGSGEAINDAVRNGRSIQKTFGDDFEAAVPNGTDPAASAGLVITSTSVYAYRDAADLASDRDGNPATIDLDGDGTEGDSPGETTSPTNYTNRNLRTDTISFFARGKYPRQTGGTIGGNTPFVADMQSAEAWVWYGHLQLPDNVAPPSATADFFGPGVGSPATNPNNVFASQFVLGREAILLRPQLPPGLQTGGYGNPTAATPIYDNQSPAKQAQTFIPLSSYSTAPTDDPKWPFSRGLQSGGTPSFTLNQSRYDLASGTIPSLQNNLVAWLQHFPATAQYWWTANNYNHGFQCNPFLPKPATPTGMAQASPYFIRGCSQFIVEFAGDFVTQNNDSSDCIYNSTTVGSPDQIVAQVVKPRDGTYGDVIADGGDGVLDFFVDKAADTSANTNQPWLWRRHVRWYGLPRDDNGDAKINGFAGKFNTVALAAPNQSNNALLDVVPVRDVVSTSVHSEMLPNAAGYTGESFEHFPDPGQVADKGANNPIVNTYADYATVAAYNNTPASPNVAAYTAAFGPFDPRVKFVRITITLDDANGRLRDGQTYQYVFPVGAK